MRNPKLNFAKGNKFRFLMDKEFFAEVHLQLARIEEAEPADNTYVLIALWSCDLGTSFPSVKVEEKTFASRTLREILTALSAKGHQVRIILWAGSKMPNMTGNKERAKALKVEEFSKKSEHGNRIKVYLESYKCAYTLIGSSMGWGASNHQKLVICSHAGNIEAVMGGFNLGNEYKSELDHGLEGEYWHDTAVVIQGPAAAVVHNEWVRRWNKKENGKPAMEEVEQDAISQGNVGITIATTNAESTPRQNDIRNMMVEHITQAQSSIYIENYAFTEPNLVEALYNKLASSDIPVVVLINHPQNELFWANTYWSYYHFNTFVHLSLARATEVEISHAENIDPEELSENMYSFDLSSVPRKIKRGKKDGECTFGQVEGGWFHWTESDGTPWRCQLKYIQNIVGPPVLYGARSGNFRTSSSGVEFRCWPYPHSKLAIFDDEVMVVGSANWTHRSMEYDGEISAFIKGNPVSAARARLLDHWLEPGGQQGYTVADWIEKAAANVKHRKTPLKSKELKGCYIMPLELADFLHPGKISTKDKTYYDSLWSMF